MPGYKQNFKQRINLANEEMVKPAYQYREDAGKSYTRNLSSTIEHELGHQRTNSNWLLPDHLTKEFLTENLSNSGKKLAAEQGYDNFGFYNYHSEPTEFDTRLLNMKKDLKRQGIIDYTKSNDFKEELLNKLDISNTKPTDINKELKQLDIDFAKGSISEKEYEMFKKFYQNSKDLVTSGSNITVSKDTKDLLEYWDTKFLAEQMKKLPNIVIPTIVGKTLHNQKQNNDNQIKYKKYKSKQ